MSEDKGGKAKITIEVELNEAFMTAAKEMRSKMGWMGPWGGMGPWRGHGMMGGKTNVWEHALELWTRNGVPSVWWTHG